MRYDVDNNLKSYVLLLHIYQESKEMKTEFFPVLMVYYNIISIVLDRLRGDTDTKNE